MFTQWQSFYQMTGEVAATLTGLLFIVASLSGSRPTPATNRGVELFTTPTVFHLVSVLVISALTLAPDGDGGPPCAVMTAWATLAFIYALTRARGLRAIENPTHWSDFWWYGAAPVAIYLALTAATVLAWLRAPHAAYLVALCLMVLLIVAIRNAWDLVTWLAPRRGGSLPSGD